MGGASYVSDAGHLVSGFLPPPDRLIFYSGLGAAAVFGVIDWPVAAAIGLGTMIARKAARSRGKAPSRSPQQQSTAKS